MRILLTAFGPFASHSYNPTEHVARLVGERWSHSAQLTVEILPVEYAAARQRVLGLGSFDIHLALGLAAERDVPTLERFAINRQDAAAPDNAGHMAAGESIDESAPLAFETTLPYRRLIERANAAGYRVRESRTAGLYVCNTVMFSAIQTSQHGGFLHLPPAEAFSVEDGAGLVEFLLTEMADHLC
ncbi:hypothetical protein INS90_05165 [Trueperella pecoris]|uniref:Pyrrolidone-carboxylate peptidase n=1 Tax=Trueperella pecoris TaxID=2733571 RepID=A0A7M1R3C7_9ACTO|nr:hypothetical protein [Trueperella pecoris]QOR48643.1 hypothetical protein INS90_05165 [Trueperella pecoris]